MQMVLRLMFSEIKVGNSVTSGTTIVNNSGQTVYIYI